MPNFLPAALGGGDNGVLHGDFGFSVKSGRPVLDLITERIPATLVLMLTAFVIWVSIAIVLGVIAAVKRYSLFDQGVTLFSYIFYSLPDVLARTHPHLLLRGAAALAALAGHRRSRGRPRRPSTRTQYWEGFWADPLPNLWTSVGTSSCRSSRSWRSASPADSRFVRSSMLDTLSQDFIRTARAKGLPRRRVIFHHGFRNAMLPILTTMSLSIAFLFSGAIVTETVFSWPGMGRLYFEGVDRPRLLPAHGHPARRLGTRRRHEHRRGRPVRAGRPAHPLLRSER